MTMKTAPTFEELKTLCEAAGHEVSPASFEDDIAIFVVSVKTLGVDTYGHPAWEASYHKGTGWVRIPGVEAHQVSGAPSPVKFGEGTTPAILDCCVDWKVSPNGPDDPDTDCYWVDTKREAIDECHQILMDNALREREKKHGA